MFNWLNVDLFNFSHIIHIADHLLTQTSTNTNREEVLLVNVGQNTVFQFTRRRKSPLLERCKKLPLLSPIAKGNRES